MGFATNSSFVDEILPNSLLLELPTAINWGIKNTQTIYHANESPFYVIMMRIDVLQLIITTPFIKG
jgi:hypothetical protein